MAINIDFDKATNILLEAFRARCTKDDDISEKIRLILGGNHKTYKYILVNGLLAKATNNDANPLTLQAGSNLEGAFDARSLCHKVLVPFERDFLYKALGGSNEPFLNKPARFKELDKDNAVRKGPDKQKLFWLIEIFESIVSSEEAKLYLACSFEFLSERIKELQSLNQSNIVYNPNLIEIYEFIIKFISKSFEGETSVLVVAVLEKLTYTNSKENFVVKAHNVNQSGASSKEVGDIDVFRDKKFEYAIEVKDKDFSSYDLGHAFAKIMENGGEKGIFIYGPNANFNSRKVSEKLSGFSKKGFYTLFANITDYCRHSLFRIGSSSKEAFIQTLIGFAVEINSKEDTRKWIQTLLADLDWGDQV